MPTSSPPCTALHPRMCEAWSTMHTVHSPVELLASPPQTWARATLIVPHLEPQQVFVCDCVAQHHQRQALHPAHASKGLQARHHIGHALVSHRLQLRAVSCSRKTATAKQGITVSKSQSSHKVEFAELRVCRSVPKVRWCGMLAVPSQLQALRGSHKPPAVSGLIPCSETKPGTAAGALCELHSYDKSQISAGVSSKRECTVCVTHSTACSIVILTQDQPALCSICKPVMLQQLLSGGAGCSKKRAENRAKTRFQHTDCALLHAGGAMLLPSWQTGVQDPTTFLTCISTSPSLRYWAQCIPDCSHKWQFRGNSACPPTCCVQLEHVLDQLLC